LSEDFRVNRIGLDLRMGDDAQTTSPILSTYAKSSLRRILTTQPYST